jgi:signal transduction histidine kinase/CheY-like chemotaxis protein
MLSFSALAIKGLRCACLIVTDLREQKRNEEILASERLNNSILEQAAEAIVVCDESARITRANQQARILCGRNPLLANFDEVFPLVRAAATPVSGSPSGTAAEEPPASDFSVRDVLAGKKFVGQELLFRRPREKQISHLLISAGALRSGDGTVIGCVVTLSDITQRKEIERAQAELLLREQQAHADAQAANQAKDVFLATLSHELRTPLSAILGWVRLLRTPPNPKIAQKAVEVIERNARMQAQLIDDILDISRIISGKIALEPRVLNLFPVIIAAIESVRLAVEAKGIRINATTRTDSDLVMGDAARLQQVVWNLLSNATKFTPTGGSIDIALTSDARNLYVSVTDTGQGIDKDFLPFVFDRFRQADGSHARRHGGLGLGLAIVRHLVEMHGGLITVSSQGQDRGTTFTVQLPRSTKPISKSGETLAVDRALVYAEVSSRLLDGIKLLVVDDQADTLEFLAMALQQQGARVTTASSAEAALKILSHPDTVLDVLISDIAMPGGDGYHLIHELHAAEASQPGKPALPAIALTAFARASDAEDALHAGFQKHISKPVDIAALAKAIAALAKKSAA